MLYAALLGELDEVYLGSSGVATKAVPRVIVAVYLQGGATLIVKRTAYLGSLESGDIMLDYCLDRYLCLESSKVYH